MAWRNTCALLPRAQSTTTERSGDVALQSLIAGGRGRFPSLPYFDVNFNFYRAGLTERGLTEMSFTAHRPTLTGERA